MFKRKIGKNNFILHSDIDPSLISAKDILKSWQKSSLKFIEENERSFGFRKPQLGALFSIKAHWTISKEVATVVMPTGTGKTEVMISIVISEKRERTCIVVPSKMLREQTIQRMSVLGKLRQIGIIDKNIQNPIVGCLCSSPSNLDELDEILDKSNVIVATSSLLSSTKFKTEYINLIANKCDTVILDEAHHVPSKTWSKIKKEFENVCCLQFTATPFRNDNKKIDGKIIYNYPLSLAQREGYFKHINFYPLYIFDDENKDYAIAEKAVELLEKDLRSGFNHVILVRTNNQKRARWLFDNIYRPLYYRYNPVLVISNISEKENLTSIKSVKEGLSNIIVGVDMFSEGIDIPQLKICAIHDKYHSLPITMQFIGRFARSNNKLGNASVVANVVDDEIEGEVDDLYSQDSDWNILLKNKSDEKIQNEVEFQQVAAGFKGTEEIPLSQLRPKISTYVYRTTDTEWNWENWTSVFNKERSHHLVNFDFNVLIITEYSQRNVDWTTNKDIYNSNWDLHMLYWNPSKGIFFINTTDRSRADVLAKKIFLNYQKLDGEQIFRCLFGIKRLMLASVGLKSAVFTNKIKYRMFAGIDIGAGLSSTANGIAIKSNLFGLGYENGKSTSIGCSYKGIIWAKLVGDVSTWMRWCDEQADKILNEKIDTSKILKGVCFPKPVKKIPNIKAYRIDFPEIIELDFKGSVKFIFNQEEILSNEVTIKLVNSMDEEDIKFIVSWNDLKEIFNFDLNDKSFTIKHVSGTKIKIRVKNRPEMLLMDYFLSNPPRICFVDGSYLEGNYYVKLPDKLPIQFKESNIIKFDWTGINIRKESQGLEKITYSIQYRIISKLKNDSSYCLVFDDDGSGEVADVVAVKVDERNKKLIVELYHCKYSKGDEPGSRLSDLYEVCGQAEKSTKWISNPKNIFNHLLERESIRLNKNGLTRYEVGNNKVVLELKNKLKVYTVLFEIFIVQPGVDKQKITHEMHQILCACESFINDTTGVQVKLIAS